MKRKSLIYLLAGLMVMFGSCTKFLDQVPDDILTTDDIFQSKTYVDEYLAQIYANLPDELAQRYTANIYSGPWTNASDEAMYNWSFNYGNQLNLSTWSKTDGEISTYWTNWYKSIRNATDFIAKIDGANSAEITNSEKSRYKAEARGLRAIYYYLLLRMYGPVPLIQKVIPADAGLDEVLLPRTSFDSCIAYVTTQLDSAYTSLPTVPVNNQFGRITKGVCKAYKEQALVLAASPLFNGNTDMASLKNTDGNELISQTADINKWKMAADAAKDFFTEFVPATYGLYETGEDIADPFVKAYMSCKDVVIDDWNKEWIFARSNADNWTQYDRTPKHVGYTSDVQGGGALGATQAIVDAYFMANGKSITDAGSGYSATGFSDFQAPFDVKERSTFNPWTNREPRFYVGITYNNSYWLNQSSNDEEVITNMQFSGNSGRQQSSSDVSPTGYIVRKNVAENGNNRGALMLRLAQLYLDYAEALNEYDPGNAEILTYLNLIRQRAGVPLYGSADLAVPNGQAAMRTAIRHERQVELAFENVRYFDCHRWKIANTTDNGPVYGMNMYVNDDAFYDKTVVQNRVFQQRDYLWPIPNDEVLKNYLLVQNPGW